MQYVIRALNLDTFAAWDEEKYDHWHEANEVLSTLRKQRGHWKQNGLVYAIVRRHV